MRWALVGIAVAAVTVPAGSAVAGTPPASAKVVFSSQEDGLWLVGSGGGGLHEIATTADGLQRSPSFSPNGSRIAYVQDGDVWIVPTAGGTPRQLTFTHGAVTSDDWSPDGAWIAFTENVGAGRDVYRKAPSGGKAQRLSYGAKHGCYADSVAWAPDSTTLAYLRETGGSCASTGLVTQRIGRAARLAVRGGGIGSPSFTAVGNLVYTAACGEPDVCGDARVGWEAAADGTHRHMVETRYLCSEGDLCVEGMRGLPAGYGRGWVEWLGYYNEDDPIADADLCYQGAYQTAGTVTTTAPQFCLGGQLASDFDVT